MPDNKTSNPPVKWQDVFLVEKPKKYNDAPISEEAIERYNSVVEALDKIYPSGENGADEMSEDRQNLLQAVQQGMINRGISSNKNGDRWIRINPDDSNSILRLKTANSFGKKNVYSNMGLDIGGLKEDLYLDLDGKLKPRSIEAELLNLSAQAAIMFNDSDVELYFSENERFGRVVFTPDIETALAGNAYANEAFAENVNEPYIVNPNIKTTEGKAGDLLSIEGLETFEKHIGDAAIKGDLSFEAANVAMDQLKDFRKEKFPTADNKLSTYEAQLNKLDNLANDIEKLSEGGLSADMKTIKKLSKAVEGSSYEVVGPSLIVSMNIPENEYVSIKSVSFNLATGQRDEIKIKTKEVPKIKTPEVESVEVRPQKVEEPPKSINFKDVYDSLKEDGALNKGNIRESLDKLFEKYEPEKEGQIEKMLEIFLKADGIDNESSFQFMQENMKVNKEKTADLLKGVREAKSSKSAPVNDTGAIEFNDANINTTLDPEAFSRNAEAMAQQENLNYKGLNKGVLNKDVKANDISLS